jgi:hypothetical protein
MWAVGGAGACFVAESQRPRVRRNAGRSGLFDQRDRVDEGGTGGV